MAQPSQPLAGADRIRSLQDEDSVFQAFDSYPWKKDPMFMSGLNAILGPADTTSPASSPQDISTHARIFYYAQRIGTTIEFAAYNAWLSRNPDHPRPDVLPEEYRPAAPPALSWQQAAPKADLFVDRSAAASGGGGPSGDPGNGGDEPNYPMAFAEMIKLLQEGKPIPGIRDIPNTIAREPVRSPSNLVYYQVLIFVELTLDLVYQACWIKKSAEKALEKDETSEPQQLDFAKTLDADFPPVESTAAGAT